MKTRMMTWMVAFALASVCTAQQESDKEDKTIPEMNGYKSVTIRKVEPDGLSIMHESGTTKIQIEDLTEVQRVKYALTMEGATAYRKQIAADELARRVSQQEAVRNQPTRPQAPTQAPRPTAVDKNPLEQWIGPGHQMAMDSYLAKFGPRFQYSGTFKSGPMKGKTLEQAIAKFEQVWASSPASVRLDWAKRAMMAGQTPEIQAATAAAKAAETEARHQRAVDAQKDAQKDAQLRAMKRKLDEIERNQRNGQ